MSRNRPPLLAVLTATFTAASPGLAQSPPDATLRRQLVDRAIAAREAGDHAQALDLFLQAGQIQMRPGLRMSLAQEQQALGRAVEACEAATACVTEAQADLTGAGNATALQGCAALVATTCATLGHLRLRWPTPTPDGLRLTVQGRGVDRSAGDRLAVSPGAVTVQAVAGRQVLFEVSLTVQRGETRDVVVHLDAAPTATPDRTLPGHDEVAPVPPTVPGVAPLTLSTPRASRGRGVGPWLVLGGGIAALGLSAMFLGLRESAKSSRDAECGIGYCTPTAAEYQTTAETDNLAMYITLGLGAAAVTAGVVWLVAGRSSAEAPRRTAFGVGASPTRGGIVIGVGGDL